MPEMQDKASGGGGGSRSRAWWERIPGAWLIAAGLDNIKQQRPHACTPIPTPLPVISCFVLLSIICWVFAIILIVFSFQATSTKVFRYDNLCPINTTCTFRFRVEKDMSGPVYVFYRLENFYQNHRRYINSFSYDQLAGKDTDYDDLEEACAPKVSLEDEEDDDSIFLPCGLIANSFFLDKFTLMKDNRKKIKIRDDDVAWETDKRLFDDPGKKTPGVRARGVEKYDDERFIVWMRTAAIPNFVKLYGVIEDDIDEGVYRMEIENSYPVAEFKGKKFFFLTTTTWLGARNIFLGWAFLILGVILFILAILFAIRQLIAPRKLGDPSYLDWN